jgi:hypothetical protein
VSYLHAEDNEQGARGPQPQPQSIDYFPACDFISCPILLHMMFKPVFDDMDLACQHALNTLGLPPYSLCVAIVD